MGTNEKSGQPAQKPEHSPDEHFAVRRKILGGLAGAPVFLTFSPHAAAQVESFARCVNTVLDEAGLPNPTTDLSTYGFEILNQDGDVALYDGNCTGQVAMISAVCLASFEAGGTLPTTQCTNAADAAAAADASTTPAPN